MWLQNRSLQTKRQVADESVEGASEPGTSADVGDPESAPGSSSSTSEEEKVDDSAAETETESKETVGLKTETAASSSPAVSTEEPNGAEFECKEEEPEEVEEDDVTEQEKRSEETPAGASGGEDSASNRREEVKQTDDGVKEDGGVMEEDRGVKEEDGGMIKEDGGVKEEDGGVKEEDGGVKEEDGGVKEEDRGVKEETSPLRCKPTVSTEDDLDEMMDIGTVDQMEQEAQMKEGEENDPSPSELQTVVLPNSAENEADVKPSASDLMWSGSSPSSDVAMSTGRDSSSPVTMLNGMKVVELSLQGLDAENPEAASHSIKSSPPSPPLAKVKDEPMDEEYEQALVSSSSTASMKDEPEKEDLQIDSVFSVTPAADALSQSNVDSSTLHMSCSFCRKNLLKGQTAFQRKGLPALFCSTDCLTTSLPLSKGAKICSNCQKLIFRPHDVIHAPDDKGVVKDFCSQSCVTSFNYKKRAVNLRGSAGPAKAPQTQSACSMCSRVSTSKHEVVLSGAVHKMCSDACFNRFRTTNNLAMSGCANCGLYCHSKPLLLKMDDGSKTLCNAECLAQFKEKTKLIQMCTMCRAPRSLAQMVDNRNSDDSVNLFCNSSCVMAFKVQSASSLGTQVNCDYCSKNAVPSYHLAMSDNSIRNFCSLPCVMSFQEKFKKSQARLNAIAKPAVGSAHTAVTPQICLDAKDLRKLRCLHCNQIIASKPELIHIKDKIAFLCSADCSMEYKKTNFVTSLCEYCKIEKITREVKRIDNKDCYFCSDGCRLLFRHELSKNWGKHCHSCLYCNSVSKKLVTAQYGGSVEDFCSEECRSKYTMLFCHVAKCDSCWRKGKLKQSLSLLGEVKHFCGLSCLLKFCCDTVATQGPIPKVSPEDTPVIASVMSLAEQQAGKASTRSSTRAAQQGRTSNVSKKAGHGRKSQRLTKAAEEAALKTSKKTVAAETQKLKSQYGVDAWKHWIQWRQTQPNLEQRRLGSRPLEFREDILCCTTAELSYGLCCFIKEVKRPNGELYSPDSLFYLCLGIQQFLFENGRVENIFMDPFYSKFSSEITNMLKSFKPVVTSSGYVHSRVEEEFLWGCKQLGAYSPIVLLNTLLFFCCKHFGFTDVEQHRQLSFAHVMRCTKTNSDGSKTTFLRFYPPIPINEAESDSDEVPAKKRKEEGKEKILEMIENTKNPLRCPVRLYEFYLSKCSESVKQRTNMFYLHPERCCVPNSPLWFSSTPLDDSTMEAMLTRILTVRELHLKTKKNGAKDPLFAPVEDEDDSE
ncbi:zinc finger MYM-type protein 4 [Nematolebias whitei]|uniref:zinc finger MYM-type protein 4 n=1 Tax=Nematolebias whitei TaxID=451745 RepID=UPI001896AE8C|nr:zinc finger MYM-type protein 4 [Nematolebias whitei]